MIYLGSDYA